MGQVELLFDLLFQVTSVTLSRLEHNSTTGQATMAKLGTKMLLVEFWDRF